MTVAALLLAALLLMGFSGLLTAAESAFTYLPRHEAETLADQEGRARMRRILADPRAHMHALRLARVLFELGYAMAVLLAALHLVPWPWLAAPAALVVATALDFLVIGVVPRHVGRAHPLGTVRRTAGLVRAVALVLGPASGALMRTGSRLAPSTEESAGFFTEEELREFVERASTSDVIEDSEAAMLHSIFELDDTRIRAVMVPRTDIVSIEQDESVEEALNLFLRSGYSRIPVLGEDFDDVRGVLYLKDVAEALFRGAGDRPGRGIPEIMRPARFVPDSQKVSALLPEMQREGTHVAVVIDEYGGTAGLVTLEDLIEELVGEIVDEYDAAQPEIAAEGDAYVVSARLGVDDLGALFGLDLEDDEVETVGGLLAKALGRVPIVGSEASIYGIRLRATRLEGRRNRVGTVMVWRDPEEDSEETAGTAEE